MTDELLDELQKYEPNLSGDLNELLEGFNRPHIKKTRMGIIYNLFRMFGDENKLDTKTLQMIEMLANKLGATKEQVQQLADINDQEHRLRQIRASILFPFPHGFQDALNEYQKLH